MRRRMMARRRRRRRRRMLILLVGGLVAFGAYKMSKKNAQRVEEHTGKKAEDLSDEELEKAMDDLHIEKEPLDDNDLDYIEGEEDRLDKEEVQAGKSAGEPSYLDELERLSDLHDEGIITDEEFEAKKKQLLVL